jgi:hypothetical protein
MSEPQKPTPVADIPDETWEEERRAVADYQIRNGFSIKMLSQDSHSYLFADLLAEFLRLRREVRELREAASTTAWQRGREFL